MSEPITQRKRVLRIVVAAVAVLAFAAAVIVLGQRYLRHPSAEELKADLEKHLRKGSTWEEAEAWFASHGIRCDPVYAPSFAKDSIEKRALKAAIPDDKPDDPGHIFIELYFSDDKLWSWVVERRAGSL
jgi:hypothetical protein